MKFKVNPDPSTRNTNAASSSASPSVPISVYRELAAELQATRAMVDSLNAKNQELTLHNQKLRQEIYRFAQSAIALKLLVEPTQPPIDLPNSSKSANSSSSRVKQGRGKSLHAHLETVDTSPTLEESVAASAIAAKLRSPDSIPSEGLYTAEQVPAHLTQERSPRELGGLWLTLTIIFIMVTAFGAGFLVVRPLLPSPNGK